MIKNFTIKYMMPAVMGLAAVGAHAQTTSQEPIRIVVGFAAGGNGDIIARLLAEELRPVMGRNVIVENKPGAGGRLAAQHLKASPADGSMYLLAPDSWSIFPTIHYSEKELRYSLKDDFAPVARIVTYPLGLYAAKSSGITNLKELIAKAKQDPSVTMYGSSGSGSITEFLGLVMTKEFGVKMTVVPFRGGSEVRTNLMGGQLQVGIVTPGDGLEADGRIQPLGFMTPERWDLAPQVPTFKEQGFNVVNGGSFSAFWTHAKTPEAERKKMEEGLKQVLSTPKVKEQLAKIYAKADFADGATMGKEVFGLIDYWTPIVKESGFKPQ